MLFSEISPFARFVRYSQIDQRFHNGPVIPCDARLFYSYEGDGRIKVGETVYEMKRGSVLIINSGVEYHIQILENPMKYIAINFDYTSDHSDIVIPVPPKKKSEYMGNEIIEHITFEDAPEFNEVVYIPKLSGLEDMMISLEKEFSQKFIYSQMQICGLMLTILGKCAAKLKKLSSGGEKTREIIAYINEHYNEKLTNLTLGEMFGFHPNYISTYVKKITGLSLHKYLLHIRLMHALDMLDSGNMSIGEIAEATGFCDIYYFSSYFKKIMGISPAQYK